MSGKYIALTKGKRALVCGCHYNLVKGRRWQYHKNGYAISGEHVDGRHKLVRMHRIINNTPRGLDTDHINRNKLDNRCSNLRTATRTQNNFNASLRSDNTSGHKGVTWDKTTKKWVAQICAGGKVKKIGRFCRIEDAISAREEHECLFSSL